MVQTDKIILNLPAKEKERLEAIQVDLDSSSLNLTCRFLMSLQIKRIYEEDIEKYKELLREAELYKNYWIFK